MSPEICKVDLEERANKTAMRPTTPVKVTTYLNPMRKEIPRQSDTQTINPDIGEHDHSEVMFDSRAPPRSPRSFGHPMRYLDFTEMQSHAEHNYSSPVCYGLLASSSDLPPPLRTRTIFSEACRVVVFYRVDTTRRWATPTCCQQDEPRLVDNLGHIATYS
ncbi:hypothetical protein Tcan_03787 [Toxocara canis]|uniref:Uncharacterized protein n=1 Tax=Toxocara canis TaxID=6265 RepID=A0A0B2VZ22_TOXCA|nr:hypothetical protein Tcan_03787 [Toxocara canis]